MGAKIEEKPEEKRGIVRLMFQDEAGYGRINTPKYCWCPKGFRPHVSCLRVREYRYAYGAVEPVPGNSFYLVMPYCNTKCMNTFLEQLSKSIAGESTIRVRICSSVEAVSIHVGNGDSYRIITTVAPDTLLEYVASAFNGWQAVKVGSQVGWVSGKQCRIE